MNVFDTAVRDEAGLRALYEMPGWVVSRKEIDHLDEHCRRYLAACRFALASSADREGRADVAPRVALVLEAEEVFTHCPQAFVRSGLWDPASWPGADEQPAPAAMLRDHVADADFTLAEAEQRMVDAVRIHLA